MKKRILAAMLTLSMVVSMTACGNSEAGGSKDSAKNNGNGDEPYTVTMVLNGSTQPDEERIEQKINEILEPELNANLDIVVLPWASASQQLQLMLSGDEKIDVFYTQATNAVQYMNAGQIIDMSELIDKYGTNIKQIYGEDIAKINQIEGFVYGVPNQIERGSIPAIFMRKDLVEKYNFDWENVKTVEDMYPFWDAIRDNEPGLYPVGDLSIQAFEDDYVAMRMIQDYYTVAGSGASSFYIKKGDDSYTVDWYPDVVKEYRREFGELYEKGYIRDDIITLQDDSADITAGKYASRLGIIKPGGEAEQKQLAGGYDYVQIALTEPFVNSLSARAAMNAVSSSSKNPEAAIRMIDVMNTDKEIFNMLNFGIEGTNYTMEDGFVKEIPDSGYFFNSGWALGNQFNAYLVEGQQEGVWEETMEINNNAEVSPISGFSFNEDPVATAMAQMSSVTSEYKFIGLYDDFDTRFEEFRPKMEQAGVLCLSFQ